jgi:hypothetical protein
MGPPGQADRDPDGEEGADLAPEQFEGLSKAQLIVQCRERMLPTTGTKEVLLRRLVEPPAPVPPAALQPVVVMEQTVSVIKDDTGCVVGFVSRLHQTLSAPMQGTVAKVMRLLTESENNLERVESERMGGVGRCEAVRYLE